jgi:hypothetical protein
VDLEEEAILPQVPGTGHRVVEGIVAVADGVGADAHRHVRPQAEPHLAAVVEGEGECRARAGQHRERGDHHRQKSSHEPPGQVRRHSPPPTRQMSRAVCKVAAL